MYSCAMAIVVGGCVIACRQIYNHHMSGSTSLGAIAPYICIQHVLDDHTSPYTASAQPSPSQRIFGVSNPKGWPEGAVFAKKSQSNLRQSPPRFQVGGASSEGVEAFATLIGYTRTLTSRPSDE